MNVSFFTFSQYHNKIPPSGSTHIRVMQLLKYWPDAQLYRYGENPDVLIFQKVYCAQDYKFPAHFENIKILDICDPDWLSGQTGVRETVDAVDAVTVPSLDLQKFMSQLTDKPVVVIPDRFDLSPLPRPKDHVSDAKTVVWFGYRHNAITLRPAIDLIAELGLNLVIISDDDPLCWDWLPPKTGQEFRKNCYKYIKYREENIYYDLQRADFCILPDGGRPIDRFKSNNKTVKAILAGLPVAHDADQVRSMMHPGVRQDYMKAHYDKTIKEYDVKRSVDQYKDLIKQLQEARNG